MSHKILKITTITLTSAMLFLCTHDASAQAWLKDRRYSEGAGIRTGDLELHPGIGGEVGYDSNWFNRSSETGVVNGAPNAAPEGAAVFRLTPSLSLSTLGDQRRTMGDSNAAQPPGAIAFRANLSATARFFLGSDAYKDQHNVSVNADARLDILPARPLTLGLIGGYIRNIRPNVIADTNLGFNTSNPYAGAELTWTPNNGTFDATLGYRFNAILFEQQAGAAFSNLRHDFNLKTRWRFRPRTSVFHDTTVGVIGYQQPERSINVLTDSVPIRTKIGLNGLISSRFAALLAVGYGGSFYNKDRASSQQYDSIIGQAEGRFYLAGSPDTVADLTKVSLTQSSIAVGYVRDFENSYLADYNDVNKGYLNVSYFFGGKVLLSLTGSVSALRFPNVFQNTGGGGVQKVLDGFTVIRPEAQLFGEYRFTDSFAVNTTLSYMQNISDVRIPYSGTAGGGSYAMSFSRFGAFAGARWFL
jgi:hypothetical protein